MEYPTRATIALISWVSAGAPPREKGVHLVSDSGLTWVDVEDATQAEMLQLGHEYSLHPLNLDDCLSKRQLPKVDDYDDNLFVLLQLPIYDSGSRLVHESQMSMFLGKNYLITVHRKELKNLGDLFRSCQSDAAKRETLMKSTTHLFYRIIDALVDDLFPLLYKVTTELDEIEDKVFDERVSAAKEINRQRRVIADLRRMIAPLRRLFLDITVNASRFSEEDLRKYFSDVSDHIEKAWAILDESRETIEIYKDTDFVLSTEITNKVLAVLTIIFTLTIPATVVGAIYGMNVPLPGGLTPGPLTFFGPFTTFLVLMVLALAPAVIMLFYFRRKGWM